MKEKKNILIPSSKCVARFLLLLFFVLAGKPASGQSMHELDSAYQEFYFMYSEMYRDTSITRGIVYQKALSFSQVYMARLSSMPSSMEGYGAVQSKLKDLYIMVRGGAYYYQEAGQDSLAYLFAKSSVDIAMRKEMYDQGLRTRSDYPEFVYYVACGAYNSQNYKDAIKYMQEYLDVTDVSLHSKVIGPLSQAKEYMRDSIIGVDVDIPNFDEFGNNALLLSWEKWAQQDEFESDSDYYARVNRETAESKFSELLQNLKEEYIVRFAKKMTLDDMGLKSYTYDPGRSVADSLLGAGMELKPYNFASKRYYDANNETYCIMTPYGDVPLHVPKNEAPDFFKNWNKNRVYEQKIAIDDNKRLAIAELTLSTPEGKIYHKSNTYNPRFIESKDYISIIDSIISPRKPTVIIDPDADVNIPESKKKDENTFVVIIANENYKNVGKVQMAKNDGTVFKQYCEKTLGVPESNIWEYPDASSIEMKNAVRYLKEVTKSSHNQNSRVIFYYAGHGIPADTLKNAYLLPTDADGKYTDDCYSLKKLYEDLSRLQVDYVVVFLDACFSGLSRDGKILENARGVAIAPRQDPPTGRIVVFSAASGDEMAYPYEEKQHGLFTYYLLKKLQETKGKVTLGELEAYVSEEVTKTSLRINNKRKQTPTVRYSDALSDWAKIRLR